MRFDVTPPRWHRRTRVRASEPWPRPVRRKAPGWAMVAAGIVAVAAIGQVVQREGVVAPEPGQPPPPVATQSPPPPAAGVSVTRVVDGDTIVVTGDVRVRLIGVDTPETVHPNGIVECFGRQASDFTTARLAGRQVRLEFDVERLDRFGRTLAYVWVGAQMFNETLLLEGYGQVATFPPNVRYVDRFLEAQRLAREHRRGLWSAC